MADNGVTAITADMTHLFWATSTGQVRRTLKSGAGSIEPLAFAGGAGTRIAVAGPALYWATLDRLHRTTTSGGSTDIVVAPGGGSIADFALGPSTVYWLTDGKVRSQNLEVLTDPSKSLVMSQAFPGFGGLTRVPEGDLFFTADTGLYRLKPDAGANNFELTLVATVQPPVGRVAHTSTHLYFIQANSKEIRRVARP
ncbi:MAG: hypothetical protein FJ104_15025 [Deltaproteobacteria bacterium]|nr:hypothetical protein [Deltaproteobacteria bacterium]